MEIDKELYKEIKEYCVLNKLIIKDYVSKLLREAFNKDKFGEKPQVLVRKNPTITEIPIEKQLRREVEESLDKKIEEMKTKDNNGLFVADPVTNEFKPITYEADAPLGQDIKGNLVYDEDIVEKKPETEKDKKENVYLLKTKKRKL